MLSQLKLDILDFVQSNQGATTTDLIRWGMNRHPPNQSADRRARELREECYLDEREINDDEMSRWGLKVRVHIFFITERGSVALLREAQRKELVYPEKKERIY